VLCRPRLGDERHADAELAAEPEARQGAVDQEVPIPLRQGAEAGEDREQQDGPGEHAHTPVIVAQDAEQDAAHDGAHQRPGHERSSLRRREVQLGRNRAQHEAEDEQVEAVHRVADRRGGQRLACFGADRGGGDGIGLDGGHGVPVLGSAGNSAPNARAAQAGL
jgi:hypothetical protein